MSSSTITARTSGSRPSLCTTTKQVSLFLLLIGQMFAIKDCKQKMLSCHCCLTPQWCRHKNSLIPTTWDLISALFKNISQNWTCLFLCHRAVWKQRCFYHELLTWTVDLPFQPVMTRSPLTLMTSSPTLRWLMRDGGEACAGARTASSQPITWRSGNDGTIGTQDRSHISEPERRCHGMLSWPLHLSPSFHPSPSPALLCFSSFSCLEWKQTPPELWSFC